MIKEFYKTICQILSASYLSRIGNWQKALKIINT